MTKENLSKEKNINHKEEINMVIKMKKKQDIKFLEVWNEFLEQKRQMVEGGQITVATFKKYEWLYNRYIKDTNLDQCNVEELTTAKLEEYILEMVKENELSKNTTSNILSSIRQLLDFAYESNYISKDITSRLDSRYILRFSNTNKNIKNTYLSNEEVKSIMDVIHEKEENSDNPLLYYAMDLMIHTGMRANEVCALKWDDIKDDYIEICRREQENGNTTYVIESYSYSGIPNKMIFITDDISNILVKMKDFKFYNEEGFIFGKKDGARYHSNTFNSDFQRIVSNTTNEKIGLYEFGKLVRNQCMFENPNWGIKEILGHKEIHNTKCYKI